MANIAHERRWAERMSAKVRAYDPNIQYGPRPVFFDFRWTCEICGATYVCPHPTPSDFECSICGNREHIYWRASHFRLPPW